MLPSYYGGREYFIYALRIYAFTVGGDGRAILQDLVTRLTDAVVEHP